MSNSVKRYFYTSGPTVLVDRLCREIGFESFINKLLPWAARYSNIYKTLPQTA